MKNIAYYNGKIDTIENMQIPMLDRAVYFGDGVYDVAYIKDGSVFALDEHIKRFINSCHLIDIIPPMDTEQLENVFYSMLENIDDKSSCILYWQSSRGTAERDHTYPKNVKSNLMAYIKPKSLPDIKKRIKLISSPDLRYELCNVKTINLIPNVMASERAKRAGCDETVLVRNGIVTECSHSNISILKDGKFITAPLDNHILPGIARGHVISLCKELGIPVEERHYDYETLISADEILVTSTTTLCRAAFMLDDREVGGLDSEKVEAIQNAYLSKLG